MTSNKSAHEKYATIKLKKHSTYIPNEKRNITVNGFGV